jgi:DNA-binding NarL/FixJ family response regulator
MEQLRILVASEYAVTREALAQLITSWSNFQVVGTAEGVAQLPNAFRKSPADVVLLEIAAGEPDALCEMAQLARGVPKARVVVLTTNESLSYVRSMLAAGVSGYVLKKASRQELSRGIRTAAAGGRYLDPRLNLGPSDIRFEKAKAPRQHKAKLSRRELEVLKRTALGFTGAEIAREMKLSIKTVQTYRARIYVKLGLKTRSDLVQHAIDIGLLRTKSDRVTLS